MFVPCTKKTQYYIKYTSHVLKQNCICCWFQLWPYIKCIIPFACKLIFLFSKYKYEKRSIYLINATRNLLWGSSQEATHFKSIKKIDIMEIFGGPYAILDRVYIDTSKQHQYPSYIRTFKIRWNLMRLVTLS